MMNLETCPNCKTCTPCKEAKKKCTHSFPISFEYWHNAWTKKYGCNNCGEYSFYIADPSKKKKHEAFTPGEYKEEFTKKKVKQKGCCFCNHEKETYFKEDFYFYGRKFKICKGCYDFYNEGETKGDNAFECEDCHKDFIKRKGREWAKICFECWKLSKTDPHRKHLIQTVAARLRKKHAKNDSGELQAKRKEFVSEFLGKNPEFVTLEMYPCKDAPDGALKTPEEIPQYFNEYQHHNTRKKLNTETIFESDKIDNFEKAMDFICSVSLILVNKKQKHSIYYAKGQRCPHIRIYDIQELADLTRVQREKAQEEFWRMVVPFFLQLADKGVWQDGHYLPLEHSVHYKYGTPYNLVFEYDPLEVTQ